MSSDTESTVCDPRSEVAPEPQVPKGPGQIRRVPQLFTATAWSTPVVPPQVQQLGSGGWDAKKKAECPKSSLLGDNSAWLNELADIPIEGAATVTPTVLRRPQARRSDRNSITLGPDSAPARATSLTPATERRGNTATRAPRGTPLAPRLLRQRAFWHVVGESYPPSRVTRNERKVETPLVMIEAAPNATARLVHLYVYLWHVSHRAWNKLCHALWGNSTTRPRTRSETARDGDGAQDSEESVPQMMTTPSEGEGTETGRAPEADASPSQHAGQETDGDLDAQHAASAIDPDEGATERPATTDGTTPATGAALPTREAPQTTGGRDITPPDGPSEGRPTQRANNGDLSSDTVSYTHLTLPTNREV